MIESGPTEGWPMWYIFKWKSLLMVLRDGSVSGEFWGPWDKDKILDLPQALSVVDTTALICDIGYVLSVV